MRSNNRQWKDVFFDIAFRIAERSKDPSTQCGAVLVSPDNVILSVGFNGPPRQLDDSCIPWEQRPQKYAYIIHAEENALLFALGSHGGEPIVGSTVYVTHAPCTECLLRLIRSNVKNVYYPADTKTVPLSKYQVEPAELLATQMFPKINVEGIDYARKP